MTNEQQQPTPEQLIIGKLSQHIGAQAIYIANLELMLDELRAQLTQSIPTNGEHVATTASA